MNIPKMRVILFKGDMWKKILNGDKIMTARHWKMNPPPLGSLFRAQTGRKKETSFAICRITGMYRWDGASSGPVCDFLECSPMEIGKREGFEGWGEFYKKYQELNKWDWENPDRSHYFIEFEVVENLMQLNLFEHTEIQYATT